MALAARDAGKLEVLAGKLPSRLAVPTDMIAEAAVRGMVDTAHAHYGQLDVPVNNAGRGLFKLNAMQRAVPLMRQGGGLIVQATETEEPEVYAEVVRRIYERR